MKTMRPLGIYVHIPYCVRRCPYCGFYSNAADGDADLSQDIENYFGLLKKELEFRKANSDSSYYVDSVYFGGGTPSLAKPALIGGLIDKISSVYDVSDDCEISMEANPGTLREQQNSPVDRLRAYKAAGVNRISIGAQSFDDDVLRTLGRIHTADDAWRAFDDARAAGFDNVSMDLMFGVPGQTEETWENTVGILASMLPEHVSFYSLQIEEDTKFYQDCKMGDMVPVTDEADRRMYHTSLQLLRDAGYEQYEISNAALPGHECRHNMKYWTFRDYLGVGASASSFMNRIRRTNPGREYKAFALDGFPDSGLYENHANSDFDNAADYMITGLRLTHGINEPDFKDLFGRTVWEVFPDARDDLQMLFESGDIVEESGRLYITEQGFDISNKILSVFV